ncbi:MAG: PepSY-associated TM helix domain-containing protein [Bacteroidota bacterium]
MGAIGGLPNKILNFFLSLFAASLPVTGFLIWRGRRKKQHKQPGAVRADVAERGISTKVSNYSA